jgi:hypothetical protein
MLAFLPPTQSPRQDWDGNGEQGKLLLALLGSEVAVSIRVQQCQQFVPAFLLFEFRQSRGGFVREETYREVFQTLLLPSVVFLGFVLLICC